MEEDNSRLEKIESPRTIHGPADLPVDHYEVSRLEHAATSLQPDSRLGSILLADSGISAFCIKCVTLAGIEPRSRRGAENQRLPALSAHWYLLFVDPARATGGRPDPVCLYC